MISIFFSQNCDYPSIYEYVTEGRRLANIYSLLELFILSRQPHSEDYLATVFNSVGLHIAELNHLRDFSRERYCCAECCIE